MTNNNNIHPLAPKIISNFSSSAICSNEETGWSCKFSLADLEIQKYINWRDEVPILKAHMEKCEEMNGRWNCGGKCMPDYPRYCDFKYADAGELCISSLQCGGKCTGLFGVDRCAEYKSGFCDNYIEIFFGIPILHSGAMCD